MHKCLANVQQSGNRIQFTMQTDSSRRQQSTDNFTTVTKEALIYSFCLAIKFSYGFLFGASVWAFIVEPYKRYVDFDRGSYLPEFLFSITVAALFMSFLWLRAIMVLFLPSLIANATQSYVVVMIFIALFSNPITNVTLNAVESVRVIGCSLTMTFEQLKEKTKLVLSPILEIMKDNNETDLNPIRQDLLDIQRIVINMKREAEFNRNQSSQEFMIERVEDQQQVLAPLPDREAALNEIGGRIKVNTGSKLVKEAVDRTREVIEDSRVEFDRDNFGLKISLDKRILRKQLAESRRMLGAGSGSLNELNLTGIMYENCLGIFRRAKPKCKEVVEEMRLYCHEAIGSFLGTLWCSPLMFGLSSTCPWIMDQLVDEDSLCGQMLSSIANLKLDPFGVTENRSVNEVYKDLTKQLVSLDDSPVDQDTLDELGPELPQRLELSVEFNNDTRRIFFATRDMLDFITDKYKLQKLLFNFLWLIYDIYTTITFFRIVRQANQYRKGYLTKVGFDNYYITGQFVHLDRRRRALGKQSLLPLTKDEQKEYITTFTCKRRTNEEKETQCASCMMIVLFLAFVFALIYFDDIFYSLLISIHDHALIYYKEIGRHELEVNVKGEGAIARLVRRLTNRLSSAYDLNRLTSTERCLPSARQTTGAFYLQFGYLLVIYLAIDQLSIYAMRLRRLTAAFFYPDKEEKRVVYLYNLILMNRQRLQKVGWSRRLADDDDAATTDKENFYTLKDAIAYMSDCVARSLACRCCYRRHQKRVKL